jgi:hypothetical protein
MWAVALLGLVLGGVRLCHYLYYMDLIHVRNTLASIDGITDVHVYGFDDLSYEVTLATFALEGRPDAVIGSRGLGEPGHVWLQRLGPWEFHECSYGFQGVFETATGKPVESLGFRDCIDIGPSGEYAAMLPVKIRDLNDVVTHYDELVRYFSTWPSGKTWRELEKRPGMRTAYCVSPTGSGSVTPPSSFPGY